MVNYNSIAVQNAIQNGAVFPDDSATFNKPRMNPQPSQDFMNPPEAPMVGNNGTQSNIGDYGQYNMQPNSYNNPVYNQPMQYNSGYPNGYPQSNSYKQKIEMPSDMYTGIPDDNFDYRIFMGKDYYDNPIFDKNYDEIMAAKQQQASQPTYQQPQPNYQQPMYYQPQMNYQQPQQQMDTVYGVPMYNQQPTYQQPMYYQPQPMMYQQPMNIGGMGYNMPYQQPMYYQPQPMGMYGQPNMMGYNMYQPGGYPQYGVNNGKYNPLMMQQPVQEAPKTYTVQGFNPLGTDKVFTTDQVKRLQEIDAEYSELNAEKMDERYSVYENSPYNYYGTMNSYYVDPVLMSQYNRELQQIKEEAEKNQYDITMRLAKGVHYYLGDVDVDDPKQWSKVEEAYKPRVYEIPSMMPANREAEYFASLVDISDYLKRGVQEAHARVTAAHNSIVSPNSNMMEFFNNAGKILWQNAFDELQHREKLARRNRYSRRDFIKYLKGEGAKYSNEINVPDKFEDRTTHYDPNDAFYSLFPNLDKDDGWSLSDDGVLTLSYPDRLKHQHDTVVNEEESNYEQQRLNFANVVYNRPNPRDPRNGGGFVNV
jgi:hypothetical protein